MKFFLPDYGVTIEADSIEEAVAKAGPKKPKSSPKS
jgi:hypothetical protein